jgi:hypothetical protein
MEKSRGIITIKTIRYADVGMEQQVDLSSAFLTNWRSSRREEAADLHATEAENDLTRYNRD